MTALTLCALVLLVIVATLPRDAHALITTIAGSTYLGCFVWDGA